MIENHTLLIWRILSSSTLEKIFRSGLDHIWKVTALKLRVLDLHYNYVNYILGYLPMMLFKRRHIIIADCQIRSCIDLVSGQPKVVLETLLPLKFRRNEYVLLNPGWSTSWQTAAVMRTVKSVTENISFRLQAWINPYIIWVTQKEWRKLWNGLFR